MANWRFKLFCCLFLAASLTNSCGDITGDLASITISPSTLEIGIGKTQYFNVVGYDTLGNVVSITPTWSVSGPIGSITSTGVFTAASSEATGSVVAIYGVNSATASITVTAKGWLSGRVSAPDGSFIAGIKVYLTTSLLDFTDVNGQYSIPDVPAGDYTAWTGETSIYLTGSLEVTITSGETTTWSPTLVLKPGVPTLPTTTITTPF